MPWALSPRACFDHSSINKEAKLAPRVGLEPTTIRLTAERSTN